MFVALGVYVNSVLFVRSPETNFFRLGSEGGGCPSASGCAELRLSFRMRFGLLVLLRGWHQCPRWSSSPVGRPGGALRRVHLGFQQHQDMKGG